MTIKYVPSMIELPGGVWVNPAKVELVRPKVEENGNVDRTGTVILFNNGTLTLNGIEPADIARAVNKGIMRNTIFEG